MKRSKLFDNAIFRILYYIARLVILNLLVIVPSFLLLVIFDLCFKDEQSSNVYELLMLIPTLLYLFPAICAATSCVVNYEMKTSESIFKEFFKSFTKNYFKCLFDSLIITAFIFGFYNSITFFLTNVTEGAIYILGLILSISFAIMLASIVFHLPLVKKYMEGCNVFDEIKLAAMMAFKELILTIAVIIVTIFLVYLCIAAQVQYVLVTCAAALPIFLMVKLTFKNYYIIYTRSKKKGEKNEK